MIVKICGITNTDDALRALSLGADWIGLNFVAGPRRIEPDVARGIIATVGGPANVVALVMLSDGGIPSSMEALVRETGVLRLQLYGDVSPQVVKCLGDSGFETILVRHVEDASSLDDLGRFLEACGPSAPSHLLLDAGSKNDLGGTGRRADWSAIAELSTRPESKVLPPIILAGGLNSENVVEGILAVRPDGVDVSSGVESSPGRKDAKKLESFLNAVREIPPHTV